MKSAPDILEAVAVSDEFDIVSSGRFLLSIQRAELLQLGLSWAVKNDRVDMVREFRRNNIHVVDNDMFEAVLSNNLRMMRELRCHARSHHADVAAFSGLFDIVHYLRENGIHATQCGANAAARNGHLEMLRDLNANGIYATTFGADQARKNGYDHVVEHLRTRGVHCSPNKSWWSLFCL